MFKLAAGRGKFLPVLFGFWIFSPFFLHTAMLTLLVAEQPTTNVAR